MVRWHQRKEGGVAPPEARIIQVALKFGVLPDQVENMEKWWLERCLLFMETEAESYEK